MADGGYQGNPEVIMPIRKPAGEATLPGWKTEINTGHKRVRVRVEHSLAAPQMLENPARLPARGQQPGTHRLSNRQSPHGDVRRVGVEGTGSYGAGITRHLVEAGVKVLEADRPDRGDRRRKGKDDDLDAISATRAALHNRRTSMPKSKDGAVESLRVTRATVIRARCNALQLLRMSIVSAPEELRDQVRNLIRYQQRTPGWEQATGTGLELHVRHRRTSQLHTHSSRATSCRTVRPRCAAGARPCPAPPPVRIGNTPGVYPVIGVSGGSVSRFQRPASGHRT